MAKNKKKIIIGIVSAVVGAGMILGITFGFKNYIANKNNSANNLGTTIENTVDPVVDPTDPVVDPTDPVVDSTDPVVDPTDPVVEEKYTEAEYKVMCEEKLENILYDKYPTLSNLELQTIDKQNGLIYYTGTVSNTSSMFLVAKFDSLKINVNNYQNLYNNIENFTTSDIEGLSSYTRLSSQVTSSSYDAFLDSVVTDSGFQQTLDNAGIARPVTINEWEDVASVVNAKIIDNKVISITFANLSGETTVIIDVYSDNTPEESSSVGNQVIAQTYKDKEFTIKSIQSFSTFVEPVAQSAELGK